MAAARKVARVEGRKESLEKPAEKRMTPDLFQKMSEQLSSKLKSFDIKLTAFKKRIDERFVKMKEEVKEVMEMENSVQEMSGEEKVFNDKSEIL